jgi:hypothetical protein
MCRTEIVPGLVETVLIAESKRIYSGFIGWLLRQYLTHPPAGARLENLSRFASMSGSVFESARAEIASPTSATRPPLYTVTSHLVQCYHLELWKRVLEPRLRGS